MRQIVFLVYLFWGASVVIFGQRGDIGSYEAWRGCSAQAARIMQEEWRFFMASTSTDEKVTIVREMWRKLSELSPVWSTIIETYYVGPIHLYPPEMQAVQRRRGYINFLIQQGITIDLLTEPAALRQHMTHCLTKMNVQKKPEGIGSSPEDAFEELTASYDQVFLQTMQEAVNKYTQLAWAGCLRSMHMLTTEATPARTAYYGQCRVLPSTGVPGQDISGTVVFEQKVGEEKSTVKVDLEGFDSTDQEILHGFHVHSIGATGNQCKDAGGHFNPRHQTHGSPSDQDRHVGDLGNVREDESGSVHAVIEDYQALLLGEESVLGKAVVIHATVDDLGLGGHEDSKTTGHAGARLACCVIQFAPEMGSIDD